MSKSLITTAMAVVLLSASAISASAVVVHEASPLQKQCMEENPKDHKAYLACVKSHKAESQDAAKPAATPAAPTVAGTPATGKGIDVQAVTK